MKAAFALASIGALWFAALCIETATRLMAASLVVFGTDLPSPTLLTISAVQAFVPWIIAVFGTLTILWLWREASPYLVQGCAGFAALCAFVTAAATVSLALPFQLCGETWPAWGEAKAPTKTAPAQVAGPARKQGCPAV
jgi:hypothetical protein